MVADGDFATRLRGLGVEPPLRLGDRYGTVVDAHGREVLAVDIDRTRPNGVAEALTKLFCSAINATAEFGDEP